MQETILVVEDGDAVRRLVCAMLIQNGYRVIEANNGRQGLEMFRKHHARIRLVITDVVMPGMDGQEMAAHLARIDPVARVLFISGFCEDTNIREGERGIVHFLPKPFTAAALHRKVREVLDGPRT